MVGLTQISGNDYEAGADAPRLAARGAGTSDPGLPGIVTTIHVAGFAKSPLEAR